MDKNRDIDRTRYMEMLYDQRQQSPNKIPSVSELFGHEFDEHEDVYWRGLIDSLENEGLLRAVHTMGRGSSGADLTHRGEEWVEQLRARRSNPAERRKAAATGLLRWIDYQDQEGPSWMQVAPAVGRIYHESEPLSATAISAAAQRLAEADLVEAVRDGLEDVGPSRVRITQLGRRCVESGLTVDEFLQQERRQEPSVQNIFSGQFTGNNIAASSTNFSQELSPTGLAADDLKVVLAAVLESLPAMNLPDDRADEVQRSAQIVQQELERTDLDGGMVKTLMGRIVGAIGEGVKTATAASLTLLIKVEMARLGIPLEG